MTSLLALPLVLLAFHGVVQPLPAPLRAQLAERMWHQGCPVPLSRLRVLTVSHWGFDRRVHRGRLVVNESVAEPLVGVFRRLYRLRFPLRRVQPLAVGDATVAFNCRRVVRSPCSTGSSGRWSDHAYGTAVDLNPVENPYTGGCGRTTDPASVPYSDRSHQRPGMVTRAVVAAFRTIGWGWGGNWTRAQDYMHFSASGR